MPQCSYFELLILLDLPEFSNAFLAALKNFTILELSTFSFLFSWYWSLSTSICFMHSDPVTKEHLLLPLPWKHLKHLDAWWTSSAIFFHTLWFSLSLRHESSVLYLAYALNNARDLSRFHFEYLNSNLYKLPGGIPKNK